ncbi:hypothetical protein CGCSCA1_v001727 [Colletotrichum siamense]|nr:hypothetical protein CGCSCA1_v001727 [Colletotrichum siamense]
MAEALGLAASVIAVADLTGKTICLTIKLKSLWEEVRDVPVILLQKAEDLQQLEELLDLAEQDVVEDATPTTVRDAIDKARTATKDVQSTIDTYTEELANKRRYRRRIAAVKVVIQKDHLRTLEQKLDRALKLCNMAIIVAYGRYSKFTHQQFTGQTSTMVVSVAKQDPLVDLRDTGSRTSRQIVLSNTTKPPDNIIFQSPSLFGRLCFGHHNQSYSFCLRIPDWLGGKVYSAVINSSIIGWKNCLLIYPVIADFEEEIWDLVEDDNVIVLQKYLQERNLTPLVHDTVGLNLLHIALLRESIETAQWLLSYGLNPGSFDECGAGVYIETADSPFELYIASFDSKTRSRQVEILKLCQAHMPDTVGSYDLIWGSMISERSFEDFKAVQMLIEPRYSAFDVSIRYSHASDGVRFSNWGWQEVTRLVPEAEPLTEGFVAMCRSDEYVYGLSATVADVMGRDLAGQHSKESDLPANRYFHRVMSNIARVDMEDITSLKDNTYLRRTGVTPFSLFLWQFLVDLDWHPPQSFDQILQSSIIHWTTTLYSGGVDLLDYGRKVRDIYQDLGWFVSEKTVWRPASEDYPREIPYTCSLLGITYGSLPSQWRLWWAPNINDYAAEFWNMVENPGSTTSGFNVPGGWTDDFDDENDDEDDEKVPFIWSEYRKIRPPV